MYALPPCSQELVRDVGEFGTTERRDFIDAFMRDANLAMSAALRQSLSGDSDSLLPLAARLINFSHTFVESAGMHRVKVRARSRLLLSAWCLHAGSRSWCVAHLPLCFRSVGPSLPLLTQASIRDVVRCTNLFDFFLTKPNRWVCASCGAETLTWCSNCIVKSQSLSHPGSLLAPEQRLLHWS